MSITTKRPSIKETVGAQYYCFNKPDEGKEFDITKYEEEVTRTETVKKVTVTENSESTIVKASGKDYTTVNQASSTDIDTEVIAVVPDDLARMRAENVNEGGLIQSGSNSTRPYFAYGKTVKKVGGGAKYEWYPKCQLVENSDEAETKEENFAEQNDTLKIKAYPYDESGNIKNYVDTDSKEFPKGLTEEAFFAKPIVTKEDLVEAVAASKEIPEQNIEEA